MSERNQDLREYQQFLQASIGEGPRLAPGVVFIQFQGGPTLDQVDRAYRQYFEGKADILTELPPPSERKGRHFLTIQVDWLKGVRNRGKN